MAGAKTMREELFVIFGERAQKVIKAVNAKKTIMCEETEVEGKTALVAFLESEDEKRE